MTGGGGILLYWEDMKEREIIGHIEKALVGREASTVPFKDLIEHLPKDPAVEKLIEVYRDDMADGPLLALNIIARRKERQARRRGAESIGFDMGDTQLGPRMPEEGEPND